MSSGPDAPKADGKTKVDFKKLVRPTGFSVLSEPEGATLDIVFIHGLQGHPRDTWTYSSSGGISSWMIWNMPTSPEEVFWPGELLPKEHKLNQTRILTYGYSSDVTSFFKYKSSNMNNITQHAQNLLVDLEQIRRDHLGRPVVFVVHSLGGILLKMELKVLTSASKPDPNSTDYSDIFLSTRGILFLGTPHGGSVTAAWGLTAANIFQATFKSLNKSILGGLQANSELLQSCHKNFVKLLENSKCKFKFHSFFEERGMSGVPMFQEKVVEYKDSIIAGHKFQTEKGIDASHQTMCKFTDSKDVGYVAVRGAIEHYIEEIRKELQGIQERLSEEQKKCISTLYFANYEDRLADVRSVDSKTCQWIKTHHLFQEWVESKDSGVLLVSGKPGCGKSVLAKYVKGELKTTLEKIGCPFHIAYFFFNNRGERIEKTTIGMLRALLHQILDNNRSLLDSIQFMEIYEKLSAGGKTPEWSFRVLKELFLSLPNHSKPATFYFIIDSLDESETGGSASETLDLLRELCSSKGKCKFKTLITSRPSTPIEQTSEELEKYPRIWLESTDNKYIVDDISAYVSSKIEKLGKKYRELLEPLRGTIIDRASGIFLWVDLVLQELNKSCITDGRPSDLKKTLDKLPVEMEGLYRSILGGTLEEDDRKDRTIMLQWVLFAKRPLTDLEFRIATGINCQRNTYTSQNGLLANEVDIGTLERRVASQSCGLLEFKTVKSDEGEDSRIVQLIHQSAKDFLLKNKNDWLFTDSNQSKDLSLCHYDLASSCLEYLSFAEFGEGPTEDTIEYEARYTSSYTERLRKNHFLKYAAVHWPNHVRLATGPGLADKLWNEFCTLIENPKKAGLAFQVFKFEGESMGSRYSKMTQPLHIVSECGLELFVSKLLLQDGIDQNSKDAAADGYTPLGLATMGGRLNVVELLLRREGLDLGSDDELAPLMLAAMGNNLEIIKLLVESGAEPSQDGSRSTPLHVAASGGYLKIVKWLLGRRDVKPDSRGEDGWTPLSLAISSGNLEIVELLLNQEGVDPRSKVGDGRTPLSLAASQGDLKIFQLLLKQDRVNLDSKNEVDGGTPLSVAAWCGNLEVVKLLLSQKGVEPDSKDDHGRTPLSHAASGGNLEVIELLLSQKGVEPDSNDSDGRTPLSWAASGDSGNLEVVKLLLSQKEIKPDSKDTNDRTPLSHAASKGNLEVVEFLLSQEGVEADSKDNDDRTPLSWAAANGELAVFKLLLKNDKVDPDSKRKDGRTPLSVIMSEGYMAIRPEIINLLLAQERVNPNSMDNDDRTPLSWAASDGYLAAISLLLAETRVDPNLKDKDGRTPLSWAQENDKPEAIELLKENSD